MRHADTYVRHLARPYGGYVPDGIHGTRGKSLPRKSAPGPYEGPVAPVDLRWLAHPQYTTSVSQPSVESVTITHPHHPLHGQRCEVIRLRRGVDPDLILRLPDGSHVAMAMSWTDYGDTLGHSAPPRGPDLPLLDLQGLRQILHLFDQLHHDGRFPPPAVAPDAPVPHSIHSRATREHSSHGGVLS